MDEVKPWVIPAKGDYEMMGPFIATIIHISTPRSPGEIPVARGYITRKGRLPTPGPDSNKSWNAITGQPLDQFTQQDIQLFVKGPTQANGELWVLTCLDTHGQGLMGQCILIDGSKYFAKAKLQEKTFPNKWALGQVREKLFEKGDRHTALVPEPKNPMEEMLLQHDKRLTDPYKEVRVVNAEVEEARREISELKGGIELHKKLIEQHLRDKNVIKSYLSSYLAYDSLPWWRKIFTKRYKVEPLWYTR